MDFARKIGKPRSSDSWPKLSDRVPQKACDPRRSSPAQQEDRRLANWKRWLADRERRQRYLAAALRREPRDLALNAHERVRAKLEARCLVEAAGRSEVTRQDRYRGNPAFWKCEQRLRLPRERRGGDGDNCNDHDDDDDDDDDDNVLFAKKSRDDEFLPPRLTRVALPAYIKREKMLIEACADPSKIDLRSKWECGAYLKHRRVQLKRELEYLEPKQPETEELMIVGRNKESIRPKEAAPRVPVITITSANDGKPSRPLLLRDPDDRAALKIQDREFVLESSRHFERLSLEATRRLRQSNDGDLDGKRYAYAPFDSSERLYEILPQANCRPAAWTLHFGGDGEIRERSLSIENRGVRVVRVEWRRDGPPSERLRDTRFFFDKAGRRVLPGQRVRLPVWFRPGANDRRRPLVVSETWRLVADPKVYPGELTMRLWAVTSSGDGHRLEQRRGHDALKAELRDRVRRSAIREIVDDLLASATSGEVHYGEDEPYEAYFLESRLFEARNPGCHYKSTTMGELKRLREDATGDDDGRWDLSLGSLKSILLRGRDRERLARFHALCRDCLLPDLCYSRPKPEKERLVYALLCMFANAFEEEERYVMCACCRGCPPAADGDDEEGGMAEADDDARSDEVFVSGGSLEVYKQAMFVRIYCRLRDTVDKICLAVESCDFFDR